MAAMTRPAFVLSIQDMDPLEPVFESLDWASGRRAGS